MIESKKKIIFTESAKERLEKLHQDINVQIEDYLRDRKNVPGDDFIEVTASDIDYLSYRIKIIRPANTYMRSLVLYGYAIFGVVLTIIGLYYDTLKKIFIEDQTRLYLIVIGFSTVIMTLLLFYMFKLKEKREKEIMESETEKQRLNEFFSKYKEK
ncbi:MAG TPA: hypothetical protein VHB54_06815 [Mucilaginibacter sp.]|nr:hypothetical protein [Mucilaginibacter sp.]